MPELALRLRIGVFETAERLLDLRRRPLRQRTGGGLRVGRRLLGRGLN